MAEENEPLEEGAAAEEPKKAKSKVLIIAVIAVLLLALLGVGGFIIVTQVLNKPEAATSKDVAAPKNENAGSQLGAVAALDPFIVNLAGEGGRRYLKVTMQVEMSSSALGDELNNKMPQIKDSVITVLASKTMDDILSIEGKFKLKEQILTRINSMLKTGVVKNVYFVEFVIQ